MSQFDFAFRRATVVDGSGGPSIRATVYVSGDRIARIEETQHDLSASQSVEAEGLVLAPGFIDVHTHDDIAMITDPRLPCKVSQGVTTVITGLCGYSPPRRQSPCPRRALDIAARGDGPCRSPCDER